MHCVYAHCSKCSKNSFQRLQSFGCEILHLHLNIFPRATVRLLCRNRGSASAFTSTATLQYCTALWSIEFDMCIWKNHYSYGVHGFLQEIRNCFVNIVFLNISRLMFWISIVNLVNSCYFCFQIYSEIYEL